MSAREVEIRIKKNLGAKVKLKISDPDSGKGKIVIEYKDYEDLDRLLEMIG